MKNITEKVLAALFAITFFIGLYLAIESAGLKTRIELTRKQPAVGIELLINGKRYISPSKNGGFLVGGGYTLDHTAAPEAWITLKKLEFKIAHVTY